MSIAVNVVESTEDLDASTILKNSDLTDYYRSIFNRCDNNKDGYINTNELKKFIENQEHYVLPEQVVKCIYKNFDRNKDEQLDFEEFLEMINHPSFKQVFQRIRSRYLKFVVEPSCQHSIKLRRTLTNTGLYEEEIKCRTHTVGMVLLSGLQILLFYINMALADKDNKGPIYEAFRFDPRRKSEIYRYFVYIFVHENTMHLFSNVVIQILIGVPLEMVHSWRVPVIYIVGAFGGCLANSVITPTTIVVGGSGGCYSFFTAHIATVILNWKEMSHPLVHLTIFGLMTIFDPVYNYIMDKNMSQVSYITHLGGAVVGLLVGVNIFRNLNVTKNEKIIWYICLVVYIVLTIVFIILDIIMTINRSK